MRRQTLDLLLTWVGAVLTVALLVAGGLLMWGYNFANSTVSSQLAAQKIYFPAKGSPALASPLIGPYLNQYAGQQMTTGPQARAWADHFIAVHLYEMTGGKTYSELSAQSMADPKNTKLADLVQTVFRGDTLRSMLLNAYAFGTFGLIALWSAIAAFIGAAVMLLLTLLGLRHYRKGDTAEVI
jgi:hypothetical protein